MSIHRRLYCNVIQMECRSKPRWTVNILSNFKMFHCHRIHLMHRIWSKYKVQCHHSRSNSIRFRAKWRSYINTNPRKHRKSQKKRSPRMSHIFYDIKWSNRSFKRYMRSSHHSDRSFKKSNQWWRISIPQSIDRWPVTETLFNLQPHPFQLTEAMVTINTDVNLIDWFFFSHLIVSLFPLEHSVNTNELLQQNRTSITSSVIGSGNKSSKLKSQSASLIGDKRPDLIINENELFDNTLYNGNNEIDLRYPSFNSDGYKQKSLEKAFRLYEDRWWWWWYCWWSCCFGIS